MFKLRNNFLMVGGLTFIVFSSIFIALYSWHNNNQFTKYGERLNISQARSLGSSLKESIYKSIIFPDKITPYSLTNRPEIEEINSTITAAFKGQSFVKTKIYNLEGLTIYSTVPLEIGQHKNMNRGFISASLKGLPSSKMALKKEISGISTVLYDRFIVETYIPIRGNDNSIVAVFELYSDVTDLVMESDRDAKLLIILFASGFGLMFGALLININRADKIIKNQYMQLDHSKSALEKAKNTLEETVASRTCELTLAINNLKIEAEQRKQIEQQLSFQVGHDSLTGLPNRRSLHEAFAEHKRAADESQGIVAILLLDMNRFKEINDTLGHHFGDQVLVQAGSRMKLVCEDYFAIVARLGGDEFSIIVTTNKTEDETTALAAALIKALRKPFMVDGITVNVGASVGIACYPQHGDDSHELLRAADVAMYQAKKMSIDVKLYESSIDDYSRQKLSFANDLVQAVKENQLVLHYQPKIDIATRTIAGFEALVRWEHPKQGLLFPDAFIDLVEMSDLIHAFTQEVIAQAVNDKKQLSSLGYAQHVSINLSARNLFDDTLFKFLESILESKKLPSNQIQLELTESAIMHNPESAITLLKRFNDMGVKIAVDDFGTGYSSLAYLRQLPVSALKIDRTFVIDMINSSQDNAIVRSTIALAHSLDLEVVAEGVENKQTLDLLKNMDCDLAQGYGICRPQPIEKLIEWLSTSVSSDDRVHG